MTVIEASGEGELVALLEAHRVMASNATKSTAKPASGKRVMCEGMAERLDVFPKPGDS